MADQKIKTTTYLKNVGKSFGYAMGDVFDDLLPTVGSLKKSVKDTYQEAKSSMRKINTSSISSSTKSFGNNQSFMNIIDDLKTGKWYNKDREDDFSMFGDFDFDSNEDWGNFDDSNSDDIENGELLEQNQNNTKMIINSVGQVGSIVSKSLGYTSAKNAEYIVKSNNMASRAIYDVTSQGFNQVTNVLLGVNNTILSIAKIGEPLSAHMQNSAVFFTNTSETLNKISSNIETLVKRTEYLDPNFKNKNKKDRKNFGSFVSSDGMLDIGEYFNFIKDNAKGWVDFAKTMASLGKMSTSNFSMKDVLTGGLKALIPQVTKDAFEQLNESINNALVEGLSRTNKKMGAGGPIAQILRSVLFGSNNINLKYDTSNYEKGAISWDGVAKKSLTEVIPTYLAKIYAALGGEEKYYNYETGRFESLPEIKVREEAKLRSKAKSVGGSFRQNILNGLAGRDNADVLKDEVEEFFYKAFMLGEDFNTIKSKVNDAAWLKKFGLSKEAANEIIKQINMIDRGKTKSRNQYIRMSGRMYSARSSAAESLRKEESSGRSNAGIVSNGFSEGGLVDSHNHTQLYYLRGMYHLLGSIYGNIHGASGLNKDMAVFNPDNGKFNESVAQSSKSQISNINYKNDIAKLKAMTYRGSEMTDEDFANTLGMSYAEIDEYFDKKNQKEQIKQVKKKVKDFTDSLGTKKSKAGKIKRTIDKVKNIYLKPWEAINNVINGLSTGINQLFWGEDGESGILAQLSKKFDSWWDEMKKKFSDKWNESSLGQSLSAEWKNVKAKAKNKISKWWNGSDADAGKTEDINYNPPSAKGRKVTKSGVVIVSEGELIIPSELNPYYNKSTNKQSQIRNEKRIEDRYFGRYADGGEVSNESGKGAKHLFQEGGLTAISGLLKFFNIVTKGNGENNKEVKQEKKDKEAIKNVLAKSFKEMNNNKGAMALGSIFGAGVSLLTGAIVGPLAGAAIGAAVGLTSKSTAVQDFLFGKGDPNSDEYQKGVLGNIGKTIKANIPTIKNTGIGAGVGLLGGTLAGSPILGMMIGSTIGYVSKSEKAKRYLFGDKDHENGVIPKELQDTIKKHAPNIVAGGMLGALAGPFGLIGNIAFGSALGLASTTEGFHKFIFGDPNDKNNPGLAQKIHDKIINNLDDILHNMGNAINGGIRRLGKRISRTLKKWGATIGDKLNKRAGDGTLLGKVLGAGKKLVNLPVDIIGGGLDKINTGFKKHNLRKGYEVYDRRKGRNLTAEERNETREQLKNGGVYQDEDGQWWKINANGKRKKQISEEEANAIRSKNKKWHQGNKYAKFDEYLEGINSREELLQLQEQLKGTQDASIARKIAINSEIKNLNSNMDNLRDDITGDKIKIDGKIQNKINTYIKRGDIDQAIALVNTLNVPDSIKQQYITNIQNTSANVEKHKKDADSKKNLRQQLQGKAGLGFLQRYSDIDIENLDDLINNELKNNNKFSEEKEAERKEEKRQENLSNNIEKITEDMEKNRNIFTSIKDTVSNILNSMIGRPLKDNPEDGFKAPSDNEIKLLPGPANNAQEPKLPAIAEDLTQMDAFGNVHQYTRNTQGELTEVKNDSETDKSRAQIDQFMGSVNTIPSMLPAITGLSTTLGLLKDKLVGDDEGKKKKGILSKLLDMLNGTDGPLSWLLSIISGSPIGKLTKSLFSGVTLKGLLADIFKVSFIVKLIKGDFDDAAKKLSGGAYGSDKLGSDDDIRYDTETGKTVTKNANGQWMTSDGEVIPESQIGIRKNGTNSLSSYAVKGTVRQLVTGEKTLVGRMFQNSKLVQNAKGIGSRAKEKIAARWAQSHGGNMGNIGNSIIDNAGSIKAGKSTGLTVYDPSNTMTDILDADGNILAHGNFVQSSANSIFDTFGGSVNAYKQLNNVDDIAKKQMKSMIKSGTDTTAAHMSYSVNKGLTSAAVDESVYKALKGSVDDTIAKIVKNLEKLPFVGSKLAGGIEGGKFAAELSETITKGLQKSSKSLAKAASSLSKVVPFITIAFMISNFTTGWEDARSTLGVIDEPNIAERAMSGLLRLIKNLIPFVGPLIPDNLVVQVLAKYVGPALGINTDELLNRQAEAKETVNNYNEEHGTDYTVGDYNKAVLKDYTWTERLGNAGKSTVGQVKSGIKNIKKKGLIKSAKDLGKDVGAKFKEAYDENGGGLGGIISGIGSGFERLMPGIIGEIPGKQVQAIGKGLKGDIKGVWDTELNDFGGGEVNEDGIQTAAPGIFSRIIGEVLLLPGKLVGTILSPIGKLGGLLVTGVKSIFGGLFKLGENIGNLVGTENAIESVAKGDIKGLWSFTSADDDDNAFVGVMKTIAGIPLKLAVTPFTLVSAAGHKVVEFVGNTAKKIKKTAGSFGDGFVESFAGIFKSDDNSSFGLDDIKDSTDDDGNPLSGFQRGVRMAGRVVAMPFAFIARGGKAIGEFIGDKVVTPIKNSVVTFGKTSKDILGASVLGAGPKAMWDTEIKQADEFDPVGGFTKGALIAEKVIMTPISLLSWLGKSAFDFISDKVVGPVKTGVTNLGTGIGSMIGSVVNGDPEGLLTYSVDDNSPLGYVNKAIFSVFKGIAVVPSAISWVGHKIHDGVAGLIDKVKTGFHMNAENISGITELAKKGDLLGVTGYELNDDEGNPLGGFNKAVGVTTKIVQAPVAIVHGIGNKIKDAFDKIVSGIKGDYDAMTTGVSSLDGYGKSSDFSAITKTKIKTDTVLGPFFHLGFGVMKVGAYIEAAIYWMTNKIKKMADDFVEKTGLGKLGVALAGLDSQETVDARNESNDQSSAAIAAVNANNDANWSHYTVSQDLKTDKNTNGAAVKHVQLVYKSGKSQSTAGQKIITGVMDQTTGQYIPLKDNGDGTYEVVDGNGKSYGTLTKDQLNISSTGSKTSLSSLGITGAGSGLAGLLNVRRTGGSSGFVSQLDPTYKGKTIAGRSFSSIGCGPAVASMVANEYGKNLSVNDAINDSKKYQNTNGVTIDYFSDVLGSKGLNTQVVSGNNTNDLYNNIASGNKTILLGSDSNNSSKQSSPFGPGNHYVLATGIDSNGNIIVKDPELNSTATYSPDILNSASYGVKISPDNISGSNYNFSGSIPVGGDTDYKGAIWKYLKEKGWTDYGIAGLMGCWENESSNRPDRMEGDYTALFKNRGGWDGVTSSQANIDDFTKALIQNYRNNGIGISESTYQVNGHYYPGIGLAQWTGTRNNALQEFASGKGMDWRTLKAQLEFANSEFDGSYNSAKTAINEATSINAATKAAYNKYEGCTRGDWLIPRQESAAQIYKDYSGKDLSNVDIGDGGSATDTSGSSSSSSESSLDYISAISNIFSTALGTVFGESNSSSSGVTGSVTENGATGDLSYLNLYTNANDQQKALVAKMASIVGKIKYGLGSVQDPDQGTASCASTVGWAYRKVLGVDGMSAGCSDQSKDSRFTTIYTNDGTNLVDPSKLLPGDIVYENWDRTSNNGKMDHAEMYAGNNKNLSHGGGIGPQWKDYNDYRKTHTMMVRRYTPFINGNTTGGSSGLLLNTDFSQYNDFGSQGNKNRIILKPSPRNYTGGASDIKSTTVEMLTSLKKSAESGSSNGISADLVTKLLQSIVSLLGTIANNTTPVDKIYQALAKYIEKGGSSTVINNSNDNEDTTNDDIDANISALVGTLAELAKG